MITVQTEDFDHFLEYQKLKSNADGDGAIVTFTGLVRDLNDEGCVSAIYIEHYPGMTEKTLMSICSKARKKWDLGQIRVIHRIGSIGVNDQIVFVGVTSKHRLAAFESTQFIMDYLKTQASFWKQENSGKGAIWVAAKESDKKATYKWER